MTHSHKVGCEASCPIQPPGVLGNTCLQAGDLRHCLFSPLTMLSSWVACRGCQAQIPDLTVTQTIPDAVRESGNISQLPFPPDNCLWGQEPCRLGKTFSVEMCSQWRADRSYKSQVPCLEGRAIVRGTCSKTFFHGSEHSSATASPVLSRVRLWLRHTACFISSLAVSVLSSVEKPI